MNNKRQSLTEKEKHIQGSGLCEKRRFQKRRSEMQWLLSFQCQFSFGRRKSRRLLVKETCFGGMPILSLRSINCTLAQIGGLHNNRSEIGRSRDRMGRTSGLSLHGLGAAPAACQNQLEIEGPQQAFQITTADSSAFSILCIFLHSRDRSTFTFATLLARRSDLAIALSALEHYNQGLKNRFWTQNLSPLV
jgi:hypothetical protein